MRAKLTWMEYKNKMKDLLYYNLAHSILLLFPWHVLHMDIKAEIVLILIIIKAVTFIASVAKVALHQAEAIALLLGSPVLPTTPIDIHITMGKNDLLVIIP